MAVGGHPVMLVHHVASCKMRMNKSKLQERDYTANKKYRKNKKQKNTCAPPFKTSFLTSWACHQLPGFRIR